MTKKYKVVSNFKDVHTGQWHSPKDEPIDLTDERVKEIETVEKLVGYKLVEEIKSSTKDEVKDKDSKK